MSEVTQQTGPTISKAQAVRLKLLQQYADAGHNLSVAYDGSRGCGKSTEADHSLLDHHMRLAAKAHTLVHRNTADELSQEITRMMALLADIYGGETVRPWLNKHASIISLEGGKKGVIEFRGIADKTDALKVLGRSFSQVRFEEVTLTDPEVYRTILQSLRHPLINGVNVTRILMTTNPWGPHASYYKKLIFDHPSAEFEMDTNKQPHKLINPNIFHIGKRPWIRFQPRAIENPWLPPDYVSDLLLETDNSKKLAHVFGDWSAVGSGMFMDGAYSDANLVNDWPLRKINPRDWSVRLGYDHGHASPFSALLVATAKDNCRDPNGWYFERGSKVVVDERHSASPDDLDKAQFPYSIGDIASMIKDMCANYGINTPRGVADSAIFASDGRSEVSEEFAKYGVYFDPSAKPPLITRGPIIKSLMGNAKRLDHERMGNGPALYICRRCTNLRQTLSGMQRHKTNPELWVTPDHSWDALNYEVLTKGGGMRVTNNYI